jgi:diguanylate cyclase (GGDEF)-like protein
MGTSLGIADTMALISSKLSKIIPWSGCALFLYDAATDQLRCRFADGVDAPRLVGLTVAAGLQAAGGNVPRGHTVLNGDPRATFAASGVSVPTDLRSAIVCPLYFEEQLIGCVEFYHTAPDYYTADHQRLIEQVAEQAGAVVHNAILFEQTQEDSLTDPLTALPNRRSLFAHLTREFARAERLGTEVALIIMDVDSFKSINDTFGHNVGDEALREVSSALQTALRPYDLCVRYAGDEFVVVISNCSREAAEAKREEFQTLLGQIRIEVAPGRVTQLAVSAGAAVFPHDGGSYDDLMAEADRRMYRDKAARRGAKRMAHASLPALDPLSTAGSIPKAGA